jgi:hypothetical protein
MKNENEKNAKSERLSSRHCLLCIFGNYYNVSVGRSEAAKLNGPVSCADKSHLIPDLDGNIMVILTDNRHRGDPCKQKENIVFITINMF